MNIQDVIRNVLDMLDGIENDQTSIPKATNIGLSPLTLINNPDDDINRFKQIIDLIDNPERSEYCNEPNQAYSNLDSVTIHAGGGLNGPKHPADIRVKDPSATPHLIGQDFESKSLEQPAHVILIKTLGEL